VDANFVLISSQRTGLDLEVLESNLERPGILDRECQQEAGQAISGAGAYEVEDRSPNTTPEEGRAAIRGLYDGLGL
jgi:hypothetical protein